MRALPEMELAEGVATSLANLMLAKAAVAAALEDVQAGCEHRFVFERPYLSGSFGKISNAYRICRHCRLVEEGSHWSGGATWSAVDHGKSVLGNVEGRIVTEIANDEFYRLRIPA